MEGVLYKKPAALLLKVDDEQPVFVKILDVYVVGQKPVAYCQLFSYIKFCRHYHAFIISPTTAHVLVTLESLSHPTPYHIRKIGGEHAIIPNSIFVEHYIHKHHGIHSALVTF